MDTKLALHQLNFQPEVFKKVKGSREGRGHKPPTAMLSHASRGGFDEIGRQYAAALDGNTHSDEAVGAPSRSVRGRACAPAVLGLVFAPGLVYVMPLLAFFGLC